MADLREKLEGALKHAYDIERELGGGGMSRVFVATERALGRRVVIKVLPPELAAGVNMERFRREIQLSAQLSHPHIVPVLASGEIGDVLYYTMPFIEGESLNNTMQKGPLDTRDVLRVLHDVVDAIAYAHSRGVIHRDIKPANILTHGTHFLVTDFGVAKAISASLPSTGMTSGGFAIGTPAYMAPEQLAADPQADHRVDIYAVGLLAYELLTGASPFASTSPQATMAAQLTRVPSPLHKVRPDVPSAVSSLIQRCLEKLPENRPQTAQDLLRELNAISTPQGAVTRRRPTLAQIFTEPSRHVTWIAALILMSLFAAGAVFAATKVVVDRAQRARAPAALAGARQNSSAADAGTPGAANASAPAVAYRDSAAHRALSAPVTEDALQRILAAFEDSLRQQFTAEFRRDSASLSESIKTEVDRRVADSIARLQTAMQRGREALVGMGDRGGSIPRFLIGAGRPLGPGEKRVLVMEFTNRSARNDTSRALARLTDSLRAALRAGTAYNVINAQVAREVFRSEDPRAMAEFVRAGAVLAGVVERRRDGQSVVRLFISEPARSPQPVSVASVPVSSDSLAAAVQKLLPPALEALGKVTWPVGGREGGRGGREGGRDGRRGFGAGPPPPARGDTIRP